MHCRSLVIGFSIHVFIGDWVNLVTPFGLHPDLLLDADQIGEHCAALIRILVFEHESCLPVGAVGDQRVINIQLLLDAFRLEDALQTQHFLNLVLHGEAVLEIQRGMRAQGLPAICFMIHDPGTEPGSDCRIVFQGVKIAACQLAHRLAFMSGFIHARSVCR